MHGNMQKVLASKSTQSQLSNGLNRTCQNEVLCTHPAMKCRNSRKMLGLNTRFAMPLAFGLCALQARQDRRGTEVYQDGSSQVAVQLACLVLVLLRGRASRARTTLDENCSSTESEAS